MRYSPPILRALLLTSCALAASRLQAQDPHVQEAFQHGAAAIHEGRNDEAEKFFREAVRLAPTLPDAHLDLGLVLGREGKLDEAIASLRQAIKLDPRLPSAHMFLGVFLYQSNHLAPAVEALQEDLSLAPHNAETLTWLGIVELASGEPEKAVAPLDEAAQLSPSDLNVLEYRGRVHSLIAQSSYAKMAKINPNAWQVHKVRAQLYAEQDRHADAIREYGMAIAQEPGNPDLLEALGDEYRAINDLAGAHTAYAQELKLAPRNPIAMYNLGSIEVDQGDYASGVPLLETMVQLHPGSAVAEYFLGRGLAGLGRDAEAVTWLEKSAQERKAGEIRKRSSYELAKVYRKLQRPDDARRALAEYERLRAATVTENAQAAESWRKLDVSNGEKSAEVAQ